MMLRPTHGSSIEKIWAMAARSNAKKIKPDWGFKYCNSNFKTCLNKYTLKYQDFKVLQSKEDKPQIISPELSRALSVFSFSMVSPKPSQ